MAEMSKPQNGWRISHDIPLSVLLAVVAQTVAIIIWGARIDARVDLLERANITISSRLTALQEFDLSLEREQRKIQLIDERQQRVLRVIEENAKRLDAINQNYLNFREEVIRGTRPYNQQTPP